MLNVRGLDILLTYECTSRCRHCSYRAGPGRGGTMTPVEVEGYLEALAGRPLEWVLLFGGEPFVCYELLRASVALAAPLTRVLVFTNGYWATDPPTARRLLAGLQEVGLDHVLFSVDAFHQEYIPLQRVAVGLEAARALGYGTIEVDNRWLGEAEGLGALAGCDAAAGGAVAHGVAARDAAPGHAAAGDAGAGGPYNRRTRGLMASLARLCDLSGVGLVQGPARMVGRAADELSDSLPLGTTTAGVCALPSYLGMDLRCPTGVELHPGGWVNLCPGLALGNARRRPLAEILGGYDPEAHPIIRELVREGPGGLLRLCGERGASPGEGPRAAQGFVDNCHLCYTARRRLRGRYPEWLAPAQVYDRF